MLLSSIRTWVAALGAATTCLAGPVVVDPRVVTPLNELVVRDPMEIARAQYLEKRISTDFTLDREWNNEVLFGGDWKEASETGADKVALQVTCIECWTKGLVTAKLTTEDIIKPIVRLEFEGVEAFVNIGVKASAGATYAINLLSSQDPLGLGLPGLSLGMVFHLDLVFSLSAEIDIEGGFYVKLADDSFLETDVFTGDITDHLFDNLGTKSLPVEVHTGSATFKAALRLRVQCGAEADLDIIGLGAGAVVGIYANIVEFVAVLDSTPDCALQTTEWFDLNVGAYARLDVIVDFTRMGAVPTVSTTLINSPTWTQCWLDNSPAETNGLPVITATSIGTLTPEPSGAVLPPPDTEVSVVPSVPQEEGSLDESSSFSTVIKQTLGYGNAAEQPKPTGSGFAQPSSNFTYPIANASSPSEEGMVTSTVYETAVYTITSCAASVINCPASFEKEIVVTKTIDAFTTVCPEGEEVAFPTSSVALPSNATPANAAAIHVFTDVMILVPCETPIIETFAPPSTLNSPAEPTTTCGGEFEEPLPLPTTTYVPPPPAATSKATQTQQELPPTNIPVIPLVTGEKTSSLVMGTLGTVATKPVPTRPIVTAGAGRAIGASGLAFAAGVAVVCGWMIM